MPRDLIIAADHDPHDRGSWSGTPRNLIDWMTAAGYSVTGVSADDPRPWDLPLYTALARPLYGRGGRAFREYFGPRKRRSQRRFARLRQQHPNALMLHTDHMWMPYDGMGRLDTFFRDASWGAYSASQRLGRRLVDRVGDDLREALQLAGHTFTTSEWARRGMVEDGAPEDRVTDVKTGVGALITAYEGPKDHANKRTLCIAKGRLHDKGVDLLLQGFAIARQTDPGLQLDLVVPAGVYPDQAGVHQRPDVSGPQLVPLYREAALYAMPARYEPLGLTYIEAQLSRAAVLGSDRCAFPELAAHGETGFILQDLTPHAIADALLRAHGDPAELARMGDRGLRHASDYTWERTAARIDRALVAAGLR